MLSVPLLAAAGAGAGAAAPWSRTRVGTIVLSPRLRARILMFDVTDIGFTCSLKFLCTCSILCSVPLHDGWKNRHRFLTAVWPVWQVPLVCWPRRHWPAWPPELPGSEHSPHRPTAF